MTFALEPLRITVPSVWEFVRDVRASVRRALQHADPELRDATVMAASELVENAVKYGASVEQLRDAQLELRDEGGKLVLHMRSGVGTDTQELERARSTVERVKLIAQAPDKHALYIGRLTELAKHPHGSAQLGLYRISSEGGFELSATLEDHVLHVVATRELS